MPVIACDQIPENTIFSIMENNLIGYFLVFIFGIILGLLWNSFFFPSNCQSELKVKLSFDKTELDKVIRREIDTMIKTCIDAHDNDGQSENESLELEEMSENDSEEEELQTKDEECDINNFQENLGDAIFRHLESETIIFGITSSEEKRERLLSQVFYSMNGLYGDEVVFLSSRDCPFEFTEGCGKQDGGASNSNAWIRLDDDDDHDDVGGSQRAPKAQSEGSRREPCERSSGSKIRDKLRNREALRLVVIDDHTEGAVPPVLWKLYDDRFFDGTPVCVNTTYGRFRSTHRLSQKLLDDAKNDMLLVCDTAISPRDAEYGLEHFFPMEDRYLLDEFMTSFASDENVYWGALFRDLNGMDKEEIYYRIPFPSSE